MFSIDGNQWAYPCAISREAEIRPSEISGMLLDKSYLNDVIGTFMSYTIQIAVPLNHRNDYTTIYELITDPVEAHTFTLPYNTGSITITGRVENISDVYVRLPGGGQYWKGISFTVIANHPSKTKTLAQTISRGRLTTPEIAEHSEGDTWIWSNGQWELSVTFRDADTTKY